MSSEDLEKDDLDALDDLISEWWLDQDEPTFVHDGVEHIASTHLARALIAAGWVSPEEHRSLTNAGANIARHASKAEAKVARAKALADNLKKGEFDTVEARALAWWVARRLSADLEDQEENER